MDVVGLSVDDHQSSDLGAASDAPDDASNEMPSIDSSVIVMRREASPRRQSTIGFSASCGDANNGYEFHTLQPVRGKDGRAERIIVRHWSAISSQFKLYPIQRGEWLLHSLSEVNFFSPYFQHELTRKK